jgi:hypothetical protein
MVNTFQISYDRILRCSLISRNRVSGTWRWRFPTCSTRADVQFQKRNTQTLKNTSYSIELHSIMFNVANSIFKEIVKLRRSTRPLNGLETAMKSTVRKHNTDVCTYNGSNAQNIFSLSVKRTPQVLMCLYSNVRRSRRPSTSGIKSTNIACSVPQAYTQFSFRTVHFLSFVPLN